MLSMKEVFEAFEKLHSYSFSTINDGYPEIRIAHFLTYDEDGLYFQTMRVKPFYQQLIEGKKVAVCALVAEEGGATHDENGLPGFPPGFYIRVSGDVKHIEDSIIEEKAKTDSRFVPLVNDMIRYPEMTTFVLHRFKGEVYDYDFDTLSRDHKIERERFSFHGMETIQPGFTINQEACIACGMCAKVCTFDAIVPGTKYAIMGNRCDECGSCYAACPVDAITAKCPVEENERRAIGKKIIAYAKAQRENRNKA